MFEYQFEDIPRPWRLKEYNKHGYATVANPLDNAYIKVDFRDGFRVQLYQQDEDTGEWELLRDEHPEENSEAEDIMREMMNKDCWAGVNEQLAELIRNIDDSDQ